jgi:hypothetical protein
MLQVKVDSRNYQVSQMDGKALQSEVICSDYFDT